MQTFLPYADYELSALCLNNEHLDNQRIEAKRILDILIRNVMKNNSPVVLMWKDYEEALKLYFNVVQSEWLSRGYKSFISKENFNQHKLIMPKWFGDKRLHLSHQSNLLRIDFKYYSKLGWEVGKDLDYYWPPKSDNQRTRLHKRKNIER